MHFLVTVPARDKTADFYTWPLQNTTRHIQKLSIISHTYELEALEANHKFGYKKIVEVVIPFLPSISNVAFKPFPGNPWAAVLSRFFYSELTQELYNKSSDKNVFKKRNFNISYIRSVDGFSINFQTNFLINIQASSDLMISFRQVYCFDNSRRNFSKGLPRNWSQRSRKASCKISYPKISSKICSGKFCEIAEILPEISPAIIFKTSLLLVVCNRVIIVRASFSISIEILLDMPARNSHKIPSVCFHSISHYCFLNSSQGFFRIPTDLSPRFEPIFSGFLLDYFHADPAQFISRSSSRAILVIALKVPRGIFPE